MEKQCALILQRGSFMLSTSTREGIQNRLLTCVTLGVIIIRQLEEQPIFGLCIVMRNTANRRVNRDYVRSQHEKWGMKNFIMLLGERGGGVT